MKSSTSGSFKFIWMSLDRPTYSIHLLHMNRERVKIVSRATLDLHTQRTKQINKSRLAKIVFGLINGLTYPKIYIWPNRRSLGQPKLEFGSNVSRKVQRLT